jgi:hypothetical protein
VNLARYRAETVRGEFKLEELAVADHWQRRITKHTHVVHQTDVLRLVQVVGIITRVNLARYRAETVRGEFKLEELAVADHWQRRITKHTHIYFYTHRPTHSHPHRLHVKSHTSADWTIIIFDMTHRAHKHKKQRTHKHKKQQPLTEHHGTSRGS